MSEEKKDPDLFAEISEIKTDVAILRNELRWVRDSVSDLRHAVEKLDKRVWALMASIVSFGIVAILAALLS